MMTLIIAGLPRKDNERANQCAASRLHTPPFRGARLAKHVDLVAFSRRIMNLAFAISVCSGRDRLGAKAPNVSRLRVLADGLTRLLVGYRCVGFSQSRS
jgi:hypothetical protein